MKFFLSSIILAFSLAISVPLGSQESLPNTPQTNQVHLPVVATCQDINIMRERLASNLKKIPVAESVVIFRLASGNFGEGLFRLYLNQETMEISVTVEFVEDQLSCLMFVGDYFTPVSQTGI